MIADFNADGKPDILVAGPVNLLSVMLGNGDGTFQSAVTTSIAAPATTFVVGDMNGDGKPDVLAQVGSAFFSYLGKGDGTFAAGVTSNASSASQFDLLVDFNGDGKADLFVFNQAVLQLGNGDGTFQAPVQLPFGSPAGSGLIGDFDGDGKLDIMGFFGISSSRQVQILFGNGDGTFRAGTMQPFTTTPLSNLTVVDLNGDGKADLVGSTGSALEVLIGKGDGTFTPDGFYNAPNLLSDGSEGSNSVVIADFNSDGKKDVAAFNTLLIGNGDGTLQGTVAVPNLAGMGAAGDFNGDGLADLAVITPASGNSSTLNIWLSDGKSGFTLAHTYQIPIPMPNINFGSAAVINWAGDLNGDGKVDLVGNIWDGSGLTVITLLGNGDGSFGAPVASRVNNVPDHAGSVALVLGDLNGDGKPDVLINAAQQGGLDGGTFYVMLSNGDGTFAAPTTPFVGTPQGGTITLGDFNNATRNWMRSSGLPAASLLLWAMGMARFSRPRSVTNAACLNSCGNMVSGDFNGDGNLDLIVPTGTGYQILAGKGDGTFNVTPAVTDGLNQFSVSQVADFNGDGHLDVLGAFSTSSGAVLGLIPGKGDGTFGNPFIYSVFGTPLVADFNGDGKLDVALTGTAQLVLLFNTAPAVAPPPPPAPPDFNVGSGSGSGTATVTAGSTATYPLSLAGSGGFTGNVALTCSVSPAGPACSVSPSSVTVSGSTAATATVSVTTTARSGLLPIGGSNERDSSRRILWMFGSLLAAAGIISVLASAQTRPRRFSWSLATVCGALLLVLATLVSGCGGSNSSNGSTGSIATGTSAGNYTVTVTAQSGSVSHNTQLTLTVK